MLSAAGIHLPSVPCGSAAFEWALTTDWANVSISAADAIGALHKIKRDIRRDKKRLFLIAGNLHGKGGDPDRFGFIETLTQLPLQRGQYKKHFFACQANHHHQGVILPRYLPVAKNDRRC
jgi:hypothetical protein